MEKLTIHTEFIKLQQALKLAGLIGNGSDVKALLSEEAVTVNGVVATERGKKLRQGDTFAYEGAEFMIVVEDE